MRGAAGCALGFESCYDLVDIGDKARASLWIVQQAQGLGGESLRRGEMLDELTHDVWRWFCGQTRVRGWVLFVVVEDIDYAQAIDIDESCGPPRR